MKTTALRLYGVDDIRLEEFELPAIGEEEVLLHVVSDSVCASTYKAIKQGAAHKRVPADIAENPVIIGHELCGEIVEVGSKLKEAWQVGQKVVVQPALKLPSGHDPGYSYPYIGGNTRYAVVPKVVLERGCLLPYNGENFFAGSLAEALGCCIRGFKGLYHTDYTDYSRTDGAKKGGKIAILGGAGPMGIGCVELAVGWAGVREVVVTDLNGDRLDFAAKMCPPEKAKEKGVDLRYVNTSGMEDPAKELIALYAERQKKEGFAYPLREGEEHGIYCKIELPKNAVAPLKKGSEIGKIKIFYLNQLLFATKIYTMEEVKKITYKDRLELIIENWLNRS